MLNRERAREVTEYCDRYGIKATADKFKLAYDSVGRYRRFYNGVKKKPKVLLIDIETAPLKAFVFRVWKENIAVNRITDEWFMLCWSAKWLGSDEVFGDVLKPKEAKKQNDKRISESIGGVLEEADVVIAHNGDRFDIPRINTRLLLNGFNPPSPYRTIDTLKVARRHFSFTHNSLAALAKVLGVEDKGDTTFKLWGGSWDGDKESLNDMFEYNKQDVIVLEQVYMKLRGWMKGHPNMNLYQDTEMSCPTCGGKDLEEVSDYSTGSNNYPAYRCKTCGAISRTGKKKQFAQSIAK